mmetsp:Transcript_26074/g.38588  ORF Transcript_26074/g.38588 Transcript_26074/m.38588 type:complete len:81 (-) Transcript_26074:137-379(-)
MTKEKVGAGDDVREAMKVADNSTGDDIEKKTDFEMGYDAGAWISMVLCIEDATDHDNVDDKGVCALDFVACSEQLASLKR